MSEQTDMKDALRDHLKPLGPSGEAGYLAWKVRKIANALEAARRHPEQSVPQHKVWEKFGLEY